MRLLAGKYRNLCVVGDDDQSIYKFRGANIQNILGFEEHFPDATVIRLEQNYRSTQNILNAANEVIKNNSGRKEKRLWTENEEGRKVKLKLYDNAIQEADQITEELLQAHDNGYSYNDCAVLYRTNAQSRVIEERMVNKGIPYQLVGGVNFYQRKEIKDILAYLKTIDNGSDDISVARIINVPKRGIGGTTIGRVQVFADEQGISFYEALRNAEYIPTLAKGRAVSKLLNFVEQISVFRVMAENYSISELIEAVLDKTGYLRELEGDDTIEAQTRLENIQEFVNKAVDYEKNAEEPSLSAFLEEVALVADIDRMDEDEDKVLLMTLHSAKGLEFDKVYLCGMEDGLFPSWMSIDSEDPSDMEEERRLAYVGITRAKKELTLTGARQRMINGETRYLRISRFCTEIPMNLLDTNTARRPAGALGGFGAGNGASGGFSGAGGGFSGGISGRMGSSSGTGSIGGKSGLVGSGSSLGGGSSKGSGSGNSSFSSGGGRTFAAHSGANSREAFKSGLGRQFKVEKMNKLPYDVGDRVKHIKFGEGTVQLIVDGKRDFEVTVDFEQVGTKKMFASFAKLQKIEG